MIFLMCICVCEYDFRLGRNLLHNSYSSDFLTDFLISFVLSVLFNISSFFQKEGSSFSLSGNRYHKIINMLVIK